MKPYRKIIEVFRRTVTRSFTILATIAIVGSTVVAPSGTAASATVPDSVSAVKASVEVEPVMPDRLTDQEMNELTEDMQNLDEGPLELAPAQSRSKAAKAPTPMCQQDTGEIWKRKSGNKYPYGAIGGKPSIKCNVEVTHLSLETTVYKKTTLGWSKVAGPFKNQNWGAKSLTQKSVEYKCKKASPYSVFRIVANGSVTYPGLTPIAGGAYSETPKAGLPCS